MTRSTGYASNSSCTSQSSADSSLNIPEAIADDSARGRSASEGSVIPTFSARSKPAVLPKPRVKPKSVGSVPSEKEAVVPRLSAQTRSMSAEFDTDDLYVEMVVSNHSPAQRRQTLDSCRSISPAPEEEDDLYIDMEPCKKPQSGGLKVRDEVYECMSAMSDYDTVKESSSAEPEEINGTPKRGAMLPNVDESLYEDMNAMQEAHESDAIGPMPAKSSPHRLGGVMASGSLPAASLSPSSLMASSKGDKRRVLLSVVMQDCALATMLMKRGKGTPKWQQRWCVLKGSDLYYARKQTDKETTDVIPLQGYKVEAAPSVHRCAFALTHPLHRTYYFRVNQDRELPTWLDALQDAIDAEASSSGSPGLGLSLASFLCKSLPAGLDSLCREAAPIPKRALLPRR